MLRMMQVTIGKQNAECPRSIRMSPGRRPSHLGAKPLHITKPTSVVMMPMTTTNFPSSRIAHERLRELSGGTRLRADGGAIQRLLRNARYRENGHRGRNP